RPVAGARVVAVSQSIALGYSWLRPDSAVGIVRATQTTTDRDGRFASEYLEGAEVWIVVPIASWPLPARVRVERPPDEVEVVLPREDDVTLRGVVRRSRDGSPVAAVTLSTFFFRSVASGRFGPGSSEWSRFDAAVTTGADGTYELRAPAGRW